MPGPWWVTFGRYRPEVVDSALVSRDPQKEPHQRGSGGAKGVLARCAASYSIRPQSLDARVTVGVLAQAVNGPNHTRSMRRRWLGPLRQVQVAPTPVRNCKREGPNNVPRFTRRQRSRASDVPQEDAHLYFTLCPTWILA